MEKALKGNPAYDQAGPHRVLGRIFFECPAWPLSVGSLPESRRSPAKAVAIAPENSTNHLFLAETLLKMGKKEEGRRNWSRFSPLPATACVPNSWRRTARRPSRCCKR